MISMMRYALQLTGARKIMAAASVYTKENTYYEYTEDLIHYEAV